MHQGRLGISVSLVALVATAALVASAPASAAGVSGRQLVVNADKSKYRMAGGLRGKWRVTAFRTLDQDPVFRAKGKSGSRAVSTGTATVPARASREGS
jgi:hypothetical protein